MEIASALSNHVESGRRRLELFASCHKIFLDPHIPSRLYSIYGMEDISYNYF